MKCKHPKKGLHCGVAGNTAIKESLFVYWRLQCQRCGEILIEQTRFLSLGGDFNEPRWYILARLRVISLRELRKIKDEQ